ncbi:MAG TPA: fumarylacetoacetate hydrolase family protein [Nitrobacter sp.]|nr:fumarylacetoacetate hydrolase family protein [Nitrobacter sp.]
MNEILSAAEIIAAARRNRMPLAALPPHIAPQHEADGYLIQSAVHEVLAREHGGLVGYKIGCTSPVMQRYLGIPHPCGGGMFASGVHADGVILKHRDFVRVGVECEIAMRLARDLDAASAPFTAESIAPAVDCYLPAIEIVDDRYVDWQSLGAPTLIADDFFAAGCVLGPPVARRHAPALVGVIGRAIVNGVDVARGTGADVLGDPHNALAWLASHLAARGRRLHAGEIVLTGSLVKTLWLDAGDRVTMDLIGLGQVAAGFE